MPFIATIVIILEDIHSILSKFAKSRTFPSRHVQCAKIILLVTDDLNNMQISKQVGLGQDSVIKWKSRFIKQLPLLQEIAQKDPSSLEETISAVLNDCPHLIRYYLQSSENTDSPDTFAVKVNEICNVYHEAEAGNHTISVHGMTGIQTLEHKYLDKPVMQGRSACMEFEYIHHGTTSLIGFFDIATRLMEKPYLNPTRTEEDFVEAVRALIETC